ncbi:MAG: hypothetical protein U0L85_05105 [Bacilli bacterium]|nr:hypothetical protein [Bacilli bacterium]
MIKDKQIVKKIIIILVLFLVAVVSMTKVADWASSTSTHAVSIASLDEKKTTAMGLTTAVAVTSSAITAIPGDVATPIADQVSELTTPLLIVICAIYLEKFLLTITGFVSFTYLIPVACALAGVYVLTQREFFRISAIKLTIFAVVIFALVPTSVKITNLIEDTFQQSINQTLELTEQIEDEAQNSSEDEASGFLGFLQSIGNGVTDIVDNAKKALSVFVDAVAVLIITSCVIPIAVLVIFVWCIKFILGADINVSHVKNVISNKSDNHKIGFVKK